MICSASPRRQIAGQQCHRKSGRRGRRRRDDIVQRQAADLTPREPTVRRQAVGELAAEHPGATGNRDFHSVRLAS